MDNQQLIDSLGTTERFDREVVRAMATQIGNEAIEYYRSELVGNMQRYVVSESDDELGHHFHILENFVFNRYIDCQPIQELLFSRDGILLGVSGDLSNRGNYYFQNDKEITSWNSQYNSGHHRTRFNWRKGERPSFNEDTYLGAETYLVAKYDPIIIVGNMNFGLKTISINNQRPISEDDLSKILPSGRTISFRDYLASVINPEKYNKEHREVVPNIRDFHDFIRFSEYRMYKDTFPVVDQYTHTRSLYGGAFPLESTKDEWIVFVNYLEKDRIHFVKVNYDTIQVKENQDNMLIIVKIRIDGVDYDISIPIITQSKFDELMRDVAKGDYSRYIIENALVMLQNELLK